MQKALLPLLLLIFSASIIFAQNNKSEDIQMNQAQIDKILKHRIINPQHILNLPIEAELFNSGSPINDPGNGPSGSDGSVLQNTTLGLTTLGAGWQSSAPNSVADDFEIASEQWSIDSILVYGYQTGSVPTPSTFTSIFVQIWDGEPGTPGANIIWGDLTTNLLGSTEWTGAYRYAEDNIGTTRPIQKVVAHTFAAPPSLGPGTYWVEVSAAGSGTSGPWMPPITITGQPVTGNAVQYTNTGGVFVPLTDGGTGDPQGMAFTIYGTTSTAVGPDPATDPSPVSGIVDVPASGNTAMWTNPAGTLTGVSVYFSDDGALVGANDPTVRVYDGSPVSSLSLAGVEPLNYLTDYFWRVVTTDATGSTNSVVWSFTTEEDPSIVNVFTDDFGTGAGNWTITNDGGNCDWAIHDAGEYTLPATAVDSVLAADADDCASGALALSTATLATPVDLSTYSVVLLEFDSDWQAFDNADSAYVDVSSDGTTWVNYLTYDDTDIRNTHVTLDISATAAGQSTVWVRFVSVQPGWDWWWAIDNVEIRATGVVPVELTSFAASVSEAGVTLNWATATETNNSGFSIERSVDNVDFNSIAFVDGMGTTSEKTNYTYVDNSVSAAKAYYRLKQIDFDGTSAYSNVVEVDLAVPTDFSISQNYPNPFNPSTTIKFGLPVEAKVTINLFNTLGEKVAQLANTDFAAGNQRIDFNASNLSSGVYFYTIEAVGVDGTNFVSSKKMMLMK